METHFFQPNNELGNYVYWWNLWFHFWSPCVPQQPQTKACLFMHCWHPHIVVMEFVSDTANLPESSKDKTCKKTEVRRNTEKFARIRKQKQWKRQWKIRDKEAAMWKIKAHLSCTWLKSCSSGSGVQSIKCPGRIRALHPVDLRVEDGSSSCALLWLLSFAAGL